MHKNKKNKVATPRPPPLSGVRVRVGREGAGAPHPGNRTPGSIQELHRDAARAGSSSLPACPPPLVVPCPRRTPLEPPGTSAGVSLTLFINITELLATSARVYGAYGNGEPTVKQNQFFHVNTFRFFLWFLFFFVYLLFVYFIFLFIYLLTIEYLQIL